MLAIVIYFGEWVLGTAMSLAAILAAREYFSLRKNDAQGLKLPGVILAGLLPLVAVQHPTYQEFAGIAFGLSLIHI